MSTAAIIAICGGLFIVLGGIFVIIEKEEPSVLCFIIGVILALGAIGMYPEQKYIITYKDGDDMVIYYNVTDVSIENNYVTYKIDDVKYIIKSDFIKVYEYEEDK